MFKRVQVNVKKEVKHFNTLPIFFSKFLKLNQTI